MGIKEVMQFVIDNWFLIVTFICVVIMAIQSIVQFVALPTESKKKEVEARLLDWVREAEAELGSGTGEFKLAKVYDKFCEAFPYLKKWYSIEQFNSLVKDALIEMEKALAKSEAARENALQLNK